MNEKSKSFTLIEILMVIIIVGILAGIVIVLTTEAIYKASIAKGQEFSSSINHSLMNDAFVNYNFDNISDSKIGTTLGINDIQESWGNSSAEEVGGSPVVRGGADCIFGKCIEFKGKLTCDPEYPCGGDSITTNEVGYPMGDNPITLEVWVKPKSVVEYSLLIGKKWSVPTGLGYDNGYYYFGIVIADDVWSYRYDTKGVLDRWTHVVGTYSNQKVTICVNGDCQKYASETPSNDGLDFQVMMGAQQEEYYHFKGFIDEARVYKEALTSKQIRNKYLAGLKSLLANKGITNNEYNQRLAELNYYCSAK
ncbi:MAG: LamG-like jellyroll fold domain-containing protein [Candidatus Paceibacterota bacterium]|jgi:prepilin-type N-terminal cleavage/methylation domain-containing protein|nr:prepilin-type N-terminal cleavage/methylation domain-containing protein [bacterium]